MKYYEIISDGYDKRKGVLYVKEPYDYPIVKDIESTSKCKFVAKLGKMFEKDLIWGKEI